MKNFSFKKFVENKDLNEVGQHVFPDQDTVKKYGNVYADGDLSVFEVSDIIGSEMINVALSEKLQYELYSLAKSEVYADTKGKSYNPRYPKSDTIEKYLGQMLRVAGKIIMDYHDKVKKISFQPVFYFLKDLKDPRYEASKLNNYFKNNSSLDTKPTGSFSNLRPDGELDQNPQTVKAPLLYTTLDKGLQTVVREANKKIPNLTLEKHDFNVFILEKPSNTTYGSNDTRHYDMALKTDKETNSQFASGRRQMNKILLKSQTWRTPEYLQKLDNAINKVNGMEKNGSITSAEAASIIKTLYDYKSISKNYDPNEESKEYRGNDSQSYTSVGHKEKLDKLMNRINDLDKQQAPAQQAPAQQAPAKKSIFGSLFGGK
jgi:hypothetical protein